jgi:hypothetical protein
MYRRERMMKMFGHDRYWKGTLYLFMYSPSLRKYLTPQYVNLKHGIIEVEKLRHAFKTCSRSEQIMLHLALHLFNGENTFYLTDLEESEDKNTIEIIVAKHRNGPIGMVKLAFMKEYNKFVEINM